MRFQFWRSLNSGTINAINARRHGLCFDGI
jgi:hypothetical protein